MLKGFKNSPMQGELNVIAVGLVVALGFSTLVKSFTDNVITPLVNATGGGGASQEWARLDDQRAADRRGGLHRRHRLLRHLHGRDLLRPGRPLPELHEEAGHDGLRGPTTDQELPAVQVGRSNWPPPAASTAPASWRRRPDAGVVPVWGHGEDSPDHIGCRGDGDPDRHRAR